MDILLGVKFIEKNNKLSSKTYNYIISTDLLRSSIPQDKLKHGYFSMKIENENGCRYSDSSVVPVDCSRFYETSITQYVRIAKINESHAFDNPYALYFKKDFDACDIYSCDIVASNVSDVCDLSMLAPTGTSAIDTLKNVSNAIEGFSERISSLENKEKENNNMFDNMVKNFEFGKAHGVELSLYGAAFPAAKDRKVAFNGTEMIDVTGMTFGGDFFFVMPVGIKEVKANDIIKHNANYVLIEEVIDNRLICLDPFNGEEITVVPTKSPFGFDFVTKLVNIAENFGFNAGAETADASNPFGNLMPFLFMFNKKDFKEMLPLMLMGNMQNANVAINPMLMMMMLKED